MGALIEYPTIEHVAMQARPYPTQLLEGCETGLVLFAAAFLGHNDAIHFVEAGMQATCLDVDRERLDEMREFYPDDWEFIPADAWWWAGWMEERGTHKWDAVSVDTFTGAAMLRSLDSLDLWTSLANRLVTATVTAGALGRYRVPDGWWASLYERTARVYWLVLQRER